MPGLSESQIAGLKMLFSVANDSVVRNLELALSEDAARGGPIAAVHQMAASEALGRRVRTVVLAPIAPLCRPSAWGTVSFPPNTLALIWNALKESASAQVHSAAAACVSPPPADEPPPAVYDELCLAAAQGLRNEAKSFHAANTLLNRSVKDGGAMFASYLDLCPIVRAALQRLPDWTLRMSDERAAAARLAYKDAVALSDDAGPQYFEILFAHLAEPWQILRVMSAIMDHPGDRYAAASELARFGEYILGDIDSRLAAFKAFDPRDGAAAGVAAGEALHVASLEIAEFETSIELSRDGPWGARVVQQRKLLAQSAEDRLEQIDKAIDGVLPQRLVRLGRGLRGLPKLTEAPDLAALKKAEGLMAFFDQSRGSAAQSGYGATRAKVAERIEERLDQYVEDLLEMMRAEDVESVERIHAYLEVAAGLMGLARGEKAAQIVRRRAAAA
jgi:predicted RNase H-like HicB family nuclease